MKILLVTDLFYPMDGGVPNVVYEMGKRLSKRNHRVAVATYKFKKDWPDHETIDGIEVWRTPLKWTPFIPFYPSAVVNMRRLVTTICNQFEGFDVVHAHLAMSGWGAFMVPDVQSAVKIYTFQGNWADEYLAEAKVWKKRLGICKLEASCMRFMQRECLKRVDHITTLSNYTKKEVSKLDPSISKDKITVIAGGVDLEKSKVKSQKSKVEFRRKIGLPENRFLILTIRRLFKRMGLENLIEAVDIVRKEFPEVFLIIGGKGYQEESLKFKVQNSKLEDHVRLEGFIPEEDKVNYLAAADLYVLPTVSLEGFGLTTLESLACGTPVLGTPTGATPEVLGGFREELILKGTSAQDIADGIMEFIKKHRGDEKLRQECREYAEGFSWEKMVGKYERLYNTFDFCPPSAKPRRGRGVLPF